MDRWLVAKAPRPAPGTAWADRHGCFGDRERLMHSRAEADWIARWLQSAPREPFGLLVWGAKGSGKSAIVEIAVRAAGLAPVRVSMCDLKTKGQVEAVVRSSACASDVTGLRKVMVVEDMDAADALDMGGFIELCNTSNPSRTSKSKVGKEAAHARLRGVCPIVATCRGAPRQEALSAFECVEIKRPDDVVVRRILEQAAKRERIRPSPGVYEFIVSATGGDVRAALNALEFGRGGVVLGAPDNARTHEQIVRAVFKGESPHDANPYDVALLQENYLPRVPQNRFDDSLAEAAATFSDWDIGALDPAQAIGAVSHELSHMWVAKPGQPIASVSNKGSQVVTRERSMRLARLAYTEHHAPLRVDTHLDTLTHVANLLKRDPSIAPLHIDQDNWEALVKLSRKTITASDRTMFKRAFRDSGGG